MTWTIVPRPFRREPDSASQDAHASQIKTVASPLSDHAAPLESNDAIFIGRQAVFDANEKVSAYQLLIRSHLLAPQAPPQTVDQNARLVVDILNTFGVATAVRDRLAFVSFPQNSLASDIVAFLPKDNFVLEFTSDFFISEEGKARCLELREAGYQLACNCKLGDACLDLISEYAHYVIYDLSQQSLQDMIKLDRALRPQGIKRLIRNVNSHADFVACKAFKLDFYQGNFFAKTETLASRRMDPSRARVMDIFNLVMNKADASVIEDAFKHDVALCYSLLCYINSVGIGMRYKVSSIRNAIMLLGYDFLWRWLSLLVYAGIDLSAAQRVLLHTAIIRGRLTELLGQMNLPEKDANLLFIVGNFSLLDALLGIPMSEATARLHLPPEASAALIHHEGRLAPYLELALAFETNQSAQAESLCASLGVSLSAASHAHLAAVEWAGLVAK